MPPICMQLNCGHRLTLTPEGSDRDTRDKENLQVNPKPQTLDSTHPGPTPEGSEGAHHEFSMSPESSEGFLNELPTSSE